MQDGIYSTNTEFPFDKLKLTPPTVLSGGNYFIKYVMNSEPLYIQPPKCKTRGGIAKSGKRMHCDLMFSNENVDFIRWMEELEAYTCKILHENRETWFETEMEMSDIENYFASPLKIYKSGKFYLARTNIATRLGKIALKIYDEDEQDIDPETIGETSHIMTILEIQGIKCSARSFQIEIEIKQMMVLRPVNLFEKCLIHSTNSTNLASLEKSISTPTTLEEFSCSESTNSTNETGHPLSSDENHLLENRVPEEEQKEQKEQDLANLAIPKNNNIESATLPTEMVEVEFDLDNHDDIDTVQIKGRNEVYYKMYKDARKKAKIAREAALSAYLDAKLIKQTYSLESNSEDEDDDEDDQDQEDADLNFAKSDHH